MQSNGRAIKHVVGGWNIIEMVGSSFQLNHISLYQMEFNVLCGNDRSDDLIHACTFLEFDLTVIRAIAIDIYEPIE